MRIYKLSKKINVGSKEIISKLAKLDIIVKSHLANVDEDTANKLIDFFKQKAKEKSTLPEIKKPVDAPEKKGSSIIQEDDIIVPEYIKHFGLKILPFENVPDPKFFFDEGNYARVHERIKDSLKAGRGLIVVTGPIGSGKTTQSQIIISEFSNDIKVIWMAEPPGNSTTLFLFIAQELDLKPSTSNRIFVLKDIRDTLLKINSEGSKCLVIIDESHLMSDDIINGIRLLNNLEEGATKLIQILLLGQEEFIETINRPEMEPFKQRIVNMENIGKMNADRIRKYISHRIQIAGGNSSIFTHTGREAVILAAGSKGVPRIINSLCDISLNVAFDRKKIMVDVDDVYAAAEGMGLGKEVFHYKIALKNREKQVPSTEENDSIIEPKEHRKQTQKISEIESFISKKYKKDLKKMILLLWLFILIFLFSIFFYCQKSGSPDLMTCLQELISF
jgi:general secretion pathway protein A